MGAAVTCGEESVPAGGLWLRGFGQGSRWITLYRIHGGASHVQSPPTTLSPRNGSVLPSGILLILKLRASSAEALRHAMLLSRRARSVLCWIAMWYWQRCFHDGDTT